jgi:PIN domain nuclease of toxin-antitoxin system
MRILLDTHVLLWSLDQPERLPNDLRDTLCRRENEVYFSAASIWEIAIKTGLKRFDFNCRPDDIAAAARETGLTELPVLASQASQVAQLPPHSWRPVRPLVDRPSDDRTGKVRYRRRYPVALRRACSGDLTATTMTKARVPRAARRAPAPGESPYRSRTNARARVRSADERVDSGAGDHCKPRVRRRQGPQQLVARRLGKGSASRGRHSEPPSSGDPDWPEQAKATKAGGYLTRCSFGRPARGGVFGGSGSLFWSAPAVVLCASAEFAAVSTSKAMPALFSRA